MHFGCMYLQLLCLIGEAFEDLGDEVCGAVINLRSKGDKLGLWTADATRADHNMRIGSVFPLLLLVIILLLDAIRHLTVYRVVT